MAQAILAHELLSRQVEVESAGLGALVGLPADPSAVKACSQLGLDISAHSARQVNESLLRQADLVFVMEQIQRYKIMERYPFASGKTFTLSDRDIEDPYLLPYHAFEHARDHILAAVKQWIPRLV